MIPGGGWSPFITDQPPEAAPLPVPHTMTYGDGIQGDYDPHVSLDFDMVTLSEGEVTFSSDFGIIGNTYGFIIVMEQSDAYGVSLLDYLDPPDLELSQPDIATDVERDRELCPSNDSIDSLDACCSIITDWFFDGEVIFNGSRTFGAIP